MSNFILIGDINLTAKRNIKIHAAVQNIYLKRIALRTQ